MFPILLGQTFYRQFHSKSVLLRYVLLAVIILLLLATQTRSSILGWIVSLGAFASLAPVGKKTKQLVLIIGFILAGMFVY
jgi:hypothetical protein